MMALAVLIALLPLVLYGAWMMNRAEDMLEERERFFND